MTHLRHAFVSLVLLIPISVSAVDTASFRAQLQGDLRRNLERHHAIAAEERAQNVQPTDFSYPYMLSGLINLHAQTKEAILLTWAKEDLLWIARCSVDAHGKISPFFGASFRFLPSYCDAYRYLQAQGVLTPGEVTEVAAQITACADIRLNRADFARKIAGSSTAQSYCFVRRPCPPPRRSTAGNGRAKRWSTTVCTVGQWKMRLSMSLFGLTIFSR
jgi:hypothetical protein